LGDARDDRGRVERHFERGGTNERWSTGRGRRGREHRRRAWECGDAVQKTKTSRVADEDGASATTRRDRAIVRCENVPSFVTKE
jgi:hypothetical protein